jgi:hypothetical protein
MRSPFSSFAAQGRPADERSGLSRDVRREAEAFETLPVFRQHPETG